MITQWHCPITKHDYRMCDQSALYLVDGTALCRDHAREAIAKREAARGATS